MTLYDEFVNECYLVRIKERKKEEATKRLVASYLPHVLELDKLVEIVDAVVSDRFQLEDRELMVHYLDEETEKGESFAYAVRNALRSFMTDVAEQIWEEMEGE
jgi:hypothetical protein